MTLFGRDMRGARAPSGDPLADDAALWLARHQLGTIDAEAFEAWRGQNPAHAIAFARALAAWERFDGGETAEDVDVGVSARHMPGVSRREWLRAAGVVLAVGVAGGGALTGRAYAWSTETTAIGESKAVRLPDGSVARLNTDSRLSWRFSPGERSLWIERGEVALRLGAGPEPMLHGENRIVRLSPGQYNARLRNDALDLLVLAGSARVDQHEVEARKGIEAAFPTVLISEKAALVREATPRQIASTLAWQKGEILFEDATLGTAVEEYNRFLTRKIVIVDRELATIPVGGRFTSSDPGAFLNAVAAGLDVRVSETDRAYLLTR
jgi:transmembrane sensor